MKQIQLAVIDPPPAAPLSHPWERLASKRLVEILLVLTSNGYSSPAQLHQHLYALAAQIQKENNEHHNAP